MAKEQSVLGLHIVLKHSDEFPCVACLKGKLTAPHLTPAGPKPRRSALRVSEQTLSRASLDAFGPLRCRGFDRSLYIVVIILAESKKLFSYTLPDLKDGTVRKFLDMFLTRLTKETDGQLLRNLHSDNFASFKSNQAYAASRGCHWEFITPRSSQQNPAERAIQYVMNALRTVMLASGLPRYLFPTVLQAVLFCLNLTPPPKDDDSFLDEDGILSREEVYSGHIPDGSPLRVLGCLAIPYTAGRFGDDDKAFAPRSDGEWVLIGYASCSLDITGYILYEMHSGRQATFDLGSVKFVEDVFPYHKDAPRHANDLSVHLSPEGFDGLGRRPRDVHHTQFLPASLAGGGDVSEYDTMPNSAPDSPPLVHLPAPSILQPVALPSASLQAHRAHDQADASFVPAPVQHPDQPLAVSSELPVLPTAAPPALQPIHEALPSLERPQLVLQPSLPVQEEKAPPPTRPSSLPDLPNNSQAVGPLPHVQASSSPRDAATTVHASAPSAAPAAEPRYPSRTRAQALPVTATESLANRAHHAKFVYVDYNRQLQVCANQNVVQRNQSFLLFIALLAAQMQEPGSHAEAMRRPDAALWKEAEEKELASLLEMETFSEKILVDDLTPRQRKLILSSRWVYKWKAVDGTVTCKARLVARGDMQRDVPDDPYSPTCRFETLRAFCAFAAQFDLEITDFDVQNAYLQSDCQDEI